MEFSTVDLRMYNTVECHRRERAYIESLNLNSIYNRLRGDRVECCDISDIISAVYPHLLLDEDYRLVMYLACEYHGVFKDILAVKREESFAPIETGRFVGIPTFQSPESSAAPMEAIYHDGSPEGYWEAVLCADFLSSLEFLPDQGWDEFLVEPPENLHTDWKVLIDPQQWYPRQYGNCVLVCRQSCRKTFSYPNVPDTISLTEYCFYKDLHLYHLFDHHKLQSNRKCRSTIPSDTRYKNGRHCCVATCNSVLIAKERVINR